MFNDLNTWRPQALEGDSFEYELLKEAAKNIKDVPGAVCEIGSRRGGGIEAIVAGMTEASDLRPIIAIDPFGNIDYHFTEVDFRKLDYTNEMRSQFIVDAHTYAREKGAHLMFWGLEDTEFFSRFSDGVPYYEQGKRMINEYALVHFDGPHNYESVKLETNWFDKRAQTGAFFVYDDVVGFYDHDMIEAEVIFPLDYELITKGSHKAVYRKN